MRRSLAVAITGLVVALLGVQGISGRAVPAFRATLQAQAAATQAAAPVVELPNREGSLKFAVLGDFGTGKRPQYELGAQMALVHKRFPFELVITVGDNLYGSQRPRDYQTKFEEPYKAVLAAGVKFYASLGNHDEREGQRYYKLFNMDGRLYYSFKAPKQDVRFFALDSTYADPPQSAWLEKELDGAREAWKIPFFHHPLYSSGKRHGSTGTLRAVWEPLFEKYGASVVFAGHDHFYERTKPQNDIVHFVVGSGGQLRKRNIDRRGGLTASGFDTDQAFLVAEIDGDELFFNAISRTGAVVDSGVIRRRAPE
jgi:diadenosine tetraphosphatase ApaH/serine/threonine PP2A family protein phosphatase